MAFPQKRGSSICQWVETGSPPIQRAFGICHNVLVDSALLSPATNIQDRLCIGGTVPGGVGWLAHWRQSLAKGPRQAPPHPALPHACARPPEPLISEGGPGILRSPPSSTWLATCPSPLSSVLPPPPHGAPANFPPCPPSQSENKQEDKPSIIIIVVAARGAGNLPSFPWFP